jgi:chemotaxis protein CheD
MNSPVDRGLARAVSAAAAGEPRFLLPGEWWFGANAPAVSTLLGSCVAVTLWHPQRRLGGMCHYLLPRRRRTFDQPLDGRYGEEAIELLAQLIRRVGTTPHDYAVHLLGGANMFAGEPAATIDIGARNVEAGRALLQQHGFHVVGTDVGGRQHRRVELDLATGAVTVSTGPSEARQRR